MNSTTFSTHDDKYLITSYGNGWAYEVHCQNTGYSFFLQDHEADDLQKVTNDFEDTDCLSEYMSVLGSKDREVADKDIDPEAEEEALRYASMSREEN